VTGSYKPQRGVIRILCEDNHSIVTKRRVTNPMFAGRSGTDRVGVAIRHATTVLSKAVVSVSTWQPGDIIVGHLAASANLGSFV
jgi:hypothetical protein